MRTATVQQEATPLSAQSTAGGHQDVADKLQPSEMLSVTKICVGYLSTSGCMYGSGALIQYSMLPVGKLSQRQTI